MEILLVLLLIAVIGFFIKLFTSHTSDPKERTKEAAGYAAWAAGDAAIGGIGCLVGLFKLVLSIVFLPFIIIFFFIQNLIGGRR